MGDFIEKLSVFDHINTFFAGVTFVIGLMILDFPFPKFATPLFLDKYGELVLGVIGCYLLGIILQRVGHSFESRFWKFAKIRKETMLFTENELMDYLRENHLKTDKKSILFCGCFFRNKLELDLHRKLANKLLHLQADNTSFTKEQCRFYFTHCEYYLAANNKAGKSERMRELRGISHDLFAVFFLLSIIGSLQFALTLFGFCNYDLRYLLVMTCIYLFIMHFMIVNLKSHTFNWAEMTLRLYAQFEGKEL